MTASITQHPACRPLLALECVDSIGLALEDIRASAAMLHTLTKCTRQPVTPPPLHFVGRIAQTMANDLDHTADLWRRLPVEALPAADHEVIAAHIASIRRHAANLGDVGDTAYVCAPSSQGVAALTARLLDAAEAVQQATNAAWTACRAQPEPAA